ncbi:MAG: leucine-rich repeat domain-containing protein [Clostridia bacterium]|nr:leucine-rich repeat domain-containing protein [Clostridia bacterium]
MRKQFNNDNMRRLILVLLLTAFVFSLGAPFISAAETGGTCGDGLKWTLSIDGVLTISGNGSMKNYTELSPAPWYGMREDIRIIHVENGVTSIGKRAFYGLENLISVTLPSSVKTIGKYAFMNCKKLKMLTLGLGVETIKASAFESCESLKMIRFPNSLKTIDDKAFYCCYSLQTVSIPSSVSTLGDMIFAYCKGLIQADVRASVAELPLWMFYDCKSLASVSFAGNISGVGNGAFEKCTSLNTLNYGGSEANGQQILLDIREGSIEDFPEYVISYDSDLISGGTSFSSEVQEDKIVTNTTTITTTENATVATTVTESQGFIVTEDDFYLKEKETSVNIEAMIENENGWNELLNEITEGEKKNIDNEKINVDISLIDTNNISSNTLNELAGKDIDLTIDMKDGSTVKIDCDRLEKTDENKVMEVTALSYQLSENENPTKNHIKTIGEAKSFLLSFDGSSEFDFSPKIYLGKDYSYQVATLYQYIPGRGLSLLQSVKVDKSGYATYYLQSTKDTTQYLIALNVKDVDEATAIIPEDIALDYGEMMYYESIEYVTTGVRLFMGLSLFQFSIAVFCVMLFLFVAVGVVMSILYRKKKLELYYQQLKANQA